CCACSKRNRFCRRGRCRSHRPSCGRRCTDFSGALRRNSSASHLTISPARSSPSTSRESVRIALRAGLERCALISKRSPQARTSTSPFHGDGPGTSPAAETTAAVTARSPLTATYRLQLNGSFTLNDARAHVAYFERLGISHLYLSPIL